MASSRINSLGVLMPQGGMSVMSSLTRVRPYRVQPMQSIRRPTREGVREVADHLHTEMLAGRIVWRPSMERAGVARKVCKHGPNAYALLRGPGEQSYTDASWPFS
jgi:hypothetical protein